MNIFQFSFPAHFDIYLFLIAVLALAVFAYVVYMTGYVRATFWSKSSGFSLEAGNEITRTKQPKRS